MIRKTISAYLVEDEPLCRSDFRQIMKSFPEVELVGEADNLTSAREFLESHSVDLLFLDLSVGRENGFDLLERISRRPLVIALTAHPQHAARGFNLDLVDYILKPVEEPRIRRALEKVRLRLTTAPFQPGRITFVAEVDRKRTVLELAEIKGAESMGNYVLLHTTRGKAIKRATFNHVRKKLPESLYLLIGRGRVVARHEVKEWFRDAEHRLYLHLGTGERVLVARSKSAGILRALRERTLV